MAACRGVGDQVVLGPTPAACQLKGRGVAFDKQLRAVLLAQRCSWQACLPQLAACCMAMRIAMRMRACSCTVSTYYTPWLGAWPLCGQAHSHCIGAMLRKQRSYGSAACAAIATQHRATGMAMALWHGKSTLLRSVLSVATTACAACAALAHVLAPRWCFTHAA